MAGSTSAMAALSQAKEIEGVSLMTAAAGVALRAEYDNMYSTKYILSDKEVLEIYQLTGYLVRPESKEVRPSCHWQLSVMRDMLRKSFLKFAKPETTRLKTLVVGAAHREIARYWKNDAVDFYIYGKEGKDVNRILLKMLSDVRDDIQKRVAPPESGEVPPHKRRGKMILRDLEDIASAYAAVRGGTVAGGRRIYLEIPDKKYDQIIVEDAHYNLRDHAWLDLFGATGASTAWVLGLLPFERLFENAPVHPVYEVSREHKPGDLGIMQIAAVGATALAASGTWTGDSLKWGAGVLSMAVLTALYGKRKYDYDEFVDTLLRFLQKFTGVARSRYGYDWDQRCTYAVQKMWEEFSRQLGHTDLVVTYRGGHSNGYIHDEDAMMTLLLKPWMGSVRWNFALQSEIVQRVGPMSIVQLTRTMVSETVVRTLSLPQNEQYVQVLDLIGSYDFVNEKEKTTPVYITLYYREYWDVFNFLRSQKDEVITVQLAMTMIRRASAGLSLGGSEVAPAWREDDEILHRVAVTICVLALECVDETDFVMTPAVKKRLQDKSSRWDRFVKTLLVVGVCLVSAGLVIPIFELYRYFSAKRLKNPLMKPGVSSVKQRAGGPAWAPMAERFGMPARGAGFELEVEVAHNTGWDKTIEECCDFIPMLGDVGLQDPVCMHARAAGPSTVDLSMDRNKIAEFRVHLVESRDGATNDGLARVLDEFINLLDKDRNGYNYSAEFEMVRGPPGVGKSYTMRKFMKMLMASGKGVAVHSPFSKLSADYSVPDGTDDPFKFYTTHKLYKVGKLDVMIVEEFTNMDERVLAYMAFKTGARKVVIIGDPKQTGLMPDEGERLFEPGGIVKLDQVREHILPKNFRSCAYTVALANAECGYALYACNDEIVVPEVRDFSELDLEKVSIKDIMCFSKATAREVQQEIGSENTVRRNQGQTHQQGTIIVLRDGDENLVKNDALFAVAVTRRKVGTPLIIYADSSEVRALMENRLRLHDPEFQANIMKLARPDYRAFYEKERTERFGPDEPPVPGSDNFHDLYAKFGPKREVQEEVVAPWLQELFYDAWRSAEADMANEQEALVKYDAENEDWKTINRLKYKRNIEWCTLDPMRHHPYASHRWTAKWPTRLIEDYVRTVLTSVQEGQVPMFILKRWLKENNLTWILYDSKTKMVDTSDLVDLTRVCYVGVLTRNHVRLPTDREYQAIFAPKEIQIFVKSHGYTHAGGQQVECKPYTYSPFATVRDFELVHGVELYDFSGVQKLDGGLSMTTVAAGITPRIGPARTLGGIGLFGNDWVPVTRKRPEMRTDYARVLLDEGDYSWGGMTSIERVDVIKDPLPLAKETPGCQDGYLLGTEVDLTAGMTLRTNAVGAAVGATKRLRGLRVRKDPLLVPLDRKGRQRPLSEYVWALSGGHGNTQLNNPVEVLGSAQRYFVKPKGGRPSVEGRRHAATMAKNLVRKHFERRSILSGPCVDAIQADFVKAALTRSYDVRAAGNELAGLSDRLVHFSNKVQFKAGRDPDPLAKQAKVGQGISAVSAEVNLRWGPLFRQAGHEYATRGKSYNIFDCYMTEQQLATKVRAAFRPLPSCADVVTSDANEFDSVQNWHSRHAESTFYSILMGRPGLFTDYMQRHREKYPVSAPGLLNGKVDEAKPSGAPDTLVGNTLVSDLYTEELIQGSGPVAMVKKGDDKSRRQYKQHVNLDTARKIARYSPLTLKITHGDVQFCGKVMTKEGLFPNLVTLVRKALARGSRDYKSWAEYQISIRDKLLEIREAGLELTVGYTASALNMRLDQVWDCWAVFQSLAHISEKQWASVAKRVERNMPTVRDASGRIRPFT